MRQRQACGTCRRCCCCVSSRLRARVENQAWFYSGFAVQLALSLGLHRPHFANEFVMRKQFTPKEVQQRTLVWAQCFVVHQR